MTKIRRTPRRPLSAFGAVLLTVLLAGLGMILGAGPALAHNVLVSSNPADGAVLDSAPAEVSFTFDQPVSTFDPALKVFGPGGNDFTSAAPTVVGNSVSTPFAAGPAGDYRAVFRVVSADGHPVTGEITFTLTEAAAGTATGTPPSESDPGAEEAASGLGAWLWVIVAIAAIAVIAAIVIAVRKPRPTRS